MIEYIINNRLKVTLIAVALVVGLVLLNGSARACISRWTGRAKTVESAGPKTDLSSDRDWQTCIFQCAKQESCGKPGTCVRACDDRSTGAKK